MHTIVPILAASAWLAACSSTYHPEYHPVSVSQFSQNLAYPVTVQNGGNPSERAPIVVAPAPSPAVVPGVIAMPLPAMAMPAPVMPVPTVAAAPQVIAVPAPGWPLAE